MSEIQIRPCVVVFAEILGAEDFARRLEPEEYAEFLRTAFAVLDEAVIRYDGHVDKHAGNVHMSTFGTPKAHEDDPERAVRAAILMQKKIDALPRGPGGKAVTLRIGMNLGKVCAGEVGTSAKQDYTVMGDVVNTANRIMEHAAAGQILVNSDVFELTRTVFEYAAPAALKPEGTGREIPTYCALRLKSGFIKRRGIEGLQSPLVGRKQEFALLAEHVERLFDAKGGVIIVSGEAGVGKSRLIEEVFTHSLGTSLEKARVITWCTSHCSPYMEKSFQAFIDLVKQICTIESSDHDEQLSGKLLSTVKKLMNGKADEVYPYLAHLLELKLAPLHETRIKHLEAKDLKLQMQLSLTQLLKDYARVQSTVYCIDDLHFADSATLETLRFFLETAPRTNALVILITRPEKDKPFWSLREELVRGLGATELALGRLTPSDTTEISRNLLKVPNLAESLVNEIVARAEGNPFFLEEIIKLLISRRVLFRDGSEWRATVAHADVDIPYTIEGIIRARLDHISSSLRGLLGEMSVIGRSFSRQILKHFTNFWDDLDQLLIQAREHGFISSSNDEDFIFNHLLLREIIYSSLPKKRARDLHGRVGRAIETVHRTTLAEHYEALFEHFSKAAMPEPAIDYGLKAAAGAARRYANAEAIACYRSILDLLTDGGNRDTRRLTLQELGKIYSRIGRNAEALDVYEQALALCTADRQSAAILGLMATTHEHMSEYGQATAYYEKARGMLGDDRLGQLEVNMGIAWVTYLRGDYEATRQILEATIKDISDHSTPETRRILARSYNILGSVYSRTGRNDDAFKSYSKALKLYELLDDMAGVAVIYNNIHGCYTQRGDYFRGLEYLRRANEIDRKTGNQLAVAISTYNIGITYEELGDLDRAEQYYREYMAINLIINNRLGDGYGNWALGRIALERDRLEQASDRFAEALEIFTRLGSKVLALSVRLAQSELAARQRFFEPAIALCDQVTADAGAMNVESLLVDTRIQKAGIRLQQAVLDESRRPELLSEAESLLTGLDESIRSGALHQETIFEVHFHQSRINAMLGRREPARAGCEKARTVLQSILQFITEPKARKQFLDQKRYRDFAEFSKAY